MRPLFDFIKQYNRIYLVAFPIIFILAKTFWPLLLVGIPLFVIYLSLVKKYVEVVILFILIVTLGDHPELGLTTLMPVRMACLIAMVLVVLYNFHTGNFKLNSIFLHFMPFIAVIFLSTQFSPEQSTSLSKGLSYLLLYFVAFHLMRRMVRETGDEIIKAIVMNSVILMIAGMGLIFVSLQTVYFGNVRFNGMFRNPNGLGLFISMNLPFFAYYFKNYSPPRSFKIMAVFLISVSLVLCSSRNALLASCLFLFFNGGFRARVALRIILFGGVLPLLFIFIQTISVEKLIISFGLEKYLRLKELESGSGRTHAWEFAKIHISENPWLGKGFGYEEYLFAYMMSYDLWKTGHQGGVHNSYFGTLLNVGFIGLAALLYFFGIMIIRIRDKLNLYPVLIVFFFTAIFESWMIASLNAFHIYFVVIMIFFLEKEKYFERIEDEPAVSLH